MTNNKKCPTLFSYAYTSPKTTEKQLAKRMLTENSS